MIIQKIAVALCIIVTMVSVGILSEISAYQSFTDVRVEKPTTEKEETVELEEPPETPVVKPAPEPMPEPTPTVDPYELELLACVIYQEAGGDRCCDECRRRVADVVLNRAESEYFPDTIHDVLTEPGQYGQFALTGVVWQDRASDPTESHAVERAYRIAEEVLSGQHSELYGGGWIWQAEFKQGSEWIECCDIYFGR